MISGWGKIQILVTTLGNILSIQIFFIGIPGIRHRGVSDKRQPFPQGTQRRVHGPFTGTV